MAGMSATEPPRTRRPALTRSRIVATAIAVARAEGIAAASMRRIAEELGSATMSLYRHVADRERLLVAMLDDVAGAITAPEPVPDPRSELTAVLTAVHDAFRRDPWVVEVLVVDGLASPLILPLVERIFIALERAGLAGRELAEAYALLFHFLYGETIATHHDRPGLVQPPDGARRRTGVPGRGPDRVGAGPAPGPRLLRGQPPAAARRPAPPRCPPVRPALINP
jgi:AcrR family transcriptional regulator